MLTDRPPSPSGGTPSRRALLAGALTGAGVLVLSACTSPSTTAGPTPTTSAARNDTFGPVTLYRPGVARPAPGALYARSVQLSSAAGAARRRPLLATFEQYADHDPVFPILRSDDGGRTWRQRSSLYNNESFYPRQ